MSKKILLSNEIIKKTDYILKKFYDENKIVSIIVDKNGKTISESSNSWFCKNYYCKNKNLCEKDHSLILKESLIWGGLFIYVCHKELVLWSIPIIEEKKLIGGIISGFCLFEQFKNLTDFYIKEFLSSKEDIKFLNQEQINVIANQLFYLIITENITDVAYLSELEKKAKVQQEIAEKIIEKKNKFENILIYEKQNKLLNSIKYSEINDIKSNLNEVLSEIYLEGINNINLLKFRMLELFVLISRNMIAYSDEKDISKLYSLTSEYVKKSEDLGDIYNFSFWLKDILNDFIDHILENRKKLGKMNKALDYIKNNLNKKLTVSEIAWKINLSESRFSFLFKKEVGVTVIEYINKLKIEKAKELLNNDNYNTSQIALALNFTDQSYFTKIFKKYCGCTPGEYIKK